MPRKQKKEEVEEKRIPSTVATQFQDSIDRPFWSLKDSASASDDFFDCYVAFKEFGCHEYIWQWQNRKLDQLLVKKLIHAYGPFFKDNPIGRKRFITFSVTSDDQIETLGRLYMSVIDTNDFAEQHGFHAPPLFEVLHAGESSDNLVRFSRLYNETVSMATDKLGRDCSPKTISVVPTHNFDTNWYPKLHQYLGSYQSSFRTKVEHLRPLIPRSAIADKIGFVAATLATKRALASYVSFEGITGTTTYPILDAGPLLFRGGINPSRIKEFIADYPGARSVTVTNAFRYAYDLDEAKSAVQELNRALPKSKHISYSQDEVKSMVQIERIFSKRFTDTMAVMPDLSDIPGELAGINRPVNAKLQNSFSLYSLGIPPELIGTGNSILECIKAGIVKDLEHLYPGIKQDLITAGALLNRENLSFLAKTHKVWAMIDKDVQLIEDFTGSSLGPTSTDSFLHRNHTSNVFHLRSTRQDFSKDLIAAARIRKCVG